MAFTGFARRGRPGVLIRRLVDGFPMTGDIAKLGALLARRDISPPVARANLIGEGKKRHREGEKRPGKCDIPL